MLRRICVASLSIVGVTLGGCFLITGGTGGYTLAATEGGCESAAECPGDRGAQICCLSTSGSSCQMRPCGTHEVQLCSKSAECADAACVPQSCLLSGATIDIRACGVIPLVCMGED